MMRALVCGGRNYRDKNRLFKVLDKHDPDIIIHGCARGADRLAGKWARTRNKKEIRFPADWQRYRKAAGPIRNKEMLMQGKPDIVIAFPGGKGTEHMIRLSIKNNVKVIRVSGKDGSSNLTPGACV